jgi:hypothetical protein
MYEFYKYCTLYSNGLEYIVWKVSLSLKGLLPARINNIHSILFPTGGDILCVI